MDGPLRRHNSPFTVLYNVLLGTPCFWISVCCRRLVFDRPQTPQHVCVNSHNKGRTMVSQSNNKELTSTSPPMITDPPTSSEKSDANGNESSEAVAKVSPPPSVALTGPNGVSTTTSVSNSSAVPSAPVVSKEEVTSIDDSDGPASKKRKVSGSIPTIPSVPVPPPPTAQPSPSLQQKNLAITQLLADYPVIQQSVKDLCSLLQLYGPLTAAQLEYNLPPVKGERLSVKHLHDILQVLVTIGLVRQVRESGSNSNNSNSASSKPLYVMCTVPRPQPLEPIGIPEQIQKAHTEMEASRARCLILEKALESTAPARSILRDLLKEFPDIISDPVYFAALKNCHVDTGSSSNNSSNNNSNNNDNAPNSSKTKSPGVSPPKQTPAPPPVMGIGSAAAAARSPTAPAGTTK